MEKSLKFCCNCGNIWMEGFGLLQYAKTRPYGGSQRERREALCVRRFRPGERPLPFAHWWRRAAGEPDENAWAKHWKRCDAKLRDYSA